MNNTVLHELGQWDYAIIVFYLLFVCSVGVICRKMSKNASDYFRGGGNMTWWLGGMSALATSISMWSFTGGAAKCYKDGFVYPTTMFIALVVALPVMVLLAPKFRRLRVITAMEAVFRRFGVGTEQFFTWFTLPQGLFWGGIGLNVMGVFMSSVFRLDLHWTIIITGVVVTMLATLGGQWAVSFGAFVQGLVLFLLVFVVAYFSINRPEIGGVSNFIHALPKRHVSFDLEASEVLVWLWILWQATFWILGQIDLRTCGKYVRVKDDRHAQGMALVAFVPMLVLLMPLMMQIPAMCSAVLYPDLHTIFPQLKNPEEGAWLAMAFTVLPQGLLGLTVCAMFSASADAADVALNSNAGFFVRNVYIRYINRSASPKRQLIIAKMTTLVFGVITIIIGLMVNSLRSLNLFDLFQVLNAMLLPPMIVPMVLGLFVKKTPSWSGWSTVIVGLIAGVVAKSVYSPQYVQHILNLSRTLTQREVVDSQYLFINAATWLLPACWFIASQYFWNSSPSEHRQRVESLFKDLSTPVDHLEEGGENQDAMQYRIIGTLCLIMGGFLIVCMAIPNPLWARMSFLFIGGPIITIGAAMWRLYRRQQKDDRSDTKEDTNSVLIESPARNS